jgi:P-type Cu2+ transporter
VRLDNQISPAKLDRQSSSDLADLERGRTKTIAIDVEGMKCAGCVRAVEKQLEQNSGVISACVNLVTAVAVVEYEVTTVKPETLAEKLTQTGFPSQIRHSDRSMQQLAAENAAKRQQQQRRQSRQLITAILLLIFSGIGHLNHLGLPYIPILSNIWFHFGLATLALLIPGRSLLIDGWRSLSHAMPNMNTLVGLGTLSAYLSSCVALLFPSLGWECFFDEPVMLLGFILLGRTLENKARDRATSALEKLISLQPAIARWLGKKNNTAETEIIVPVEQVKIGEWLRVLPGDKIPVDGTIVAGETTVDESMLTGESVAVLKRSPDLVRAGTIAQSGMITIEVTGIGKDTALAKIINLVETAQTRKAPVQQLADTVAGYFAYGVMAIATVTFLFWYCIGTKIWPEVLVTSGHTMHMGEGMMPEATSPLLLSLKVAIAVLVIACPCALGLATPTAILVGTSIGAERGILIKGGDVLETVHQVDTVVLDKTGTLTIGQLQVTDVIPFSDLTPEKLLQLAASVESGSNHPLATAIVAQARNQKLSLLATEEFDTAIGLGMSAKVAGETIYLGNREWLERQQINITPEAEVKAVSLAKSGKTVIYLAKSGILCGLIALQDSLRPDAAATVNRLQEMGLELVLVTGDRQEIADAIASSLKLDRVIAEVKPEGKAEIIESLQRSSVIVAAIGDGINDAPALARADVGIALQAGTDIAMETADIVLMQNKLWDVIESIQLSQATVNKIRQNLAWALAYNIIAIPIAAGVLLPQFHLILSPVWAAVAMASSSIIVVTNSILLNLTSKRGRRQGDMGSVGSVGSN